MINYAIIMPLFCIFFFAKNIVHIFLGGLLCGAPWGVFSTLTVAYATECCPVSLRAFMTGWINFCWVFGSWAWRVPYATQWLWPIPLFLVMWLAPESPWWLIRHDRIDEATRSVARLASADEVDKVNDTVAAMIRTVQFEIEQAKTADHGSWRELFKGVDRRRTEIACMACVCQSLCGSGFTSNTGYILEQAGISQEISFRLGFGSNLITLGANVAAFYMLARIGRRTIYLVGLATLFWGLIAIGCSAIAIDKGATGARWGQAVLQIIWNFCYVAFLGPPCYAVFSEASSTRMRNKTIALSRILYGLVGIPVGAIVPYMINPLAWNWQGKGAFFWAPSCAIAFIWTWFRLPEFKDRTYYELDILFARKVPARRFKHAVVERDADEHERGIET